MIVVDASVILELLLNTPAAGAIGRRIMGIDETLHAPHLLDVEVAQTLRRYERSGEIMPERGVVALQDLLDFPLVRYPHDVFLPRIREPRHNLTTHDASCVAPAESLDAPLVTRDTRLATAHGHHAIIERI